MKQKKLFKNFACSHDKILNKLNLLTFFHQYVSDKMNVQKQVEDET